jgi:hypothetical protein
MEFQENSESDTNNFQTIGQQAPKPKKSLWKIVGIIIVIVAVLLVAWVGYIVYRISPSNIAKDPEVISQLEKVLVIQRDAKRIGDIWQFKMALGLYYQDHKQYPESLEQLVPSYGVVTKAPVPADAPCTEQTNNYNYSPTMNSYSLTFCLGSSNYEGFVPGMHTLDPSGIK